MISKMKARPEKMSVVLDSASAGFNIVHDNGNNKDGGTVDLTPVEYEVLRMAASKMSFNKIVQYDGRSWLSKLDFLDSNKLCFTLTMLKKVKEKDCVGFRALHLEGKHYLAVTRVTHTITKVRGSYWWNVIGNPTSILSGSNVRPTYPKKNTLEESLRVMFAYCFQMMISISRLDSDTVKEKVALGHYTLHNIQFATYLPTDDKSVSLNLMSSAYGKTLVDCLGRATTLASLLGLSFRSFEREINTLNLSAEDSLNDPTVSEHTGFMLTKKTAGGANVFTLSCYDKKAQSEYTGLNTLSDERSNKLIDSRIRMDFTIHKMFFMVLFNAAEKLNPEINYHRNGKYVIEPVANNICRAIASIEEKYEGGFTNWLVREILISRACMFSIWPILDFDYDVLSAVKEALAKPRRVDLSMVYKEWEESASNETLLKVISRYTSSSTAAVITGEIEAETGLSPYIPAIFVTALRTEMATAGFDSQDYYAYYKSMETGDYSNFDSLFKRGKKIINAIVKTERKRAIRVLSNAGKSGMTRMAVASIKTTI